MQLIFVHGWSVTSTDTYGSLPQALSNAAAGYGLELDIRHIFLGRYISFHDEITMDDIARAMDRALRDLPGNSDTTIAPFSCITHSTGGPVVRCWVDKFYGAARLKDLPMVHLVMLAPANMNYRCFSLVQSRDQVIRKQPLTLTLVPGDSVKQPEPVALRVYNEYSHSGKKMGIMRSIGPDQTDAPVVTDILKCFRVNTRETYRQQAKEFSLATEKAQAKGDRYCMLVFNIRDDRGESIGKDDYDMVLLAGNQYRPQKMPKGFFMDRQMNNDTGRLIYYLDANKMGEIKDGKFGIRIIARPARGFSCYAAAEFRSDGIDASKILAPNQTTYVDIVLHRLVDKNVFRFGPVTEKPVSFKGTQPSGEPVENR